MTAWQILVNNEAGQEPYVNFKGFLHGLSELVDMMRV